MPTGSYTAIIERMVPEAALPGDIVHVDGRLLGRHTGLMRYTVGQRRGLGLSQSHVTGGEPLYVVRLEPRTNRVVVGPREALATRAVDLRDVNWIGAGDLADLPAGGLEIAVRLRSTRPPVPALLHRDTSGRLHVELAAVEAGVSPGQACVFYESAESCARVLGGGFIIATEPAPQAGPQGIVQAASA